MHHAALPCAALVRLGGIEPPTARALVVRRAQSPKSPITPPALCIALVLWPSTYRLRRGASHSQMQWFNVFTSEINADSKTTHYYAPFTLYYVVCQECSKVLNILLGGFITFVCAALAHGNRRYQFNNAELL